MFKKIDFAVKNGIGILKLNRPDVYNALDDQITYEIQDALKIAAKDPEVRVLIITGEGKAFCSGQDLKAASGQEKRSFKDSLIKRYNPIIRSIRNMPKPVVCGLNGVAAGAGCSLALACDMIIAKESSSLIEVFINIGLVLDSGSSFFLPRIMSYQKAFELASTSKKITAKQALELGMVNEVVPDGDFENVLQSWADRFASAPTKGIGLIKTMLNRSYNFSLDQALEYEVYCQQIAGSSNDYKEGVNAFLEKRKPDFKGN